MTDQIHEKAASFIAHPIFSRSMTLFFLPLFSSCVCLFFLLKPFSFNITHSPQNIHGLLKLEYAKNAPNQNMLNKFFLFMYLMAYFACCVVNINLGWQVSYDSITSYFDAAEILPRFKKWDRSNNRPNSHIAKRAYRLPYICINSVYWTSSSLKLSNEIDAL